MTREDVKFYGEFFKELGLSELKVVNRDEELYLKKDICCINSAGLDREASQDNTADVISNKLFCGSINATDSITTSSDNNSLLVENNLKQESMSNSQNVSNNQVITNNQTVVETASNIVPVKAPLVGIYYAKPSPNAEVFVKVGDYINKGDVLCIIEAMKMFNEIKAEVSGKVEEICVNNGNVVEYGQTLFNISQ